MADFVAVCKIDDLPPGEVRQFKVNGREIALARVSTGDCYAVDGRCTHLRGPLGEGTLDGTTLTCPWHGSQFDVTSGRLLAWGCRSRARCAPWRGLCLGSCAGTYGPTRCELRTVRFL